MGDGKMELGSVARKSDPLDRLRNEGINDFNRQAKEKSNEKGKEEAKRKARLRSLIKGLQKSSVTPLSNKDTVEIGKEGNDTKSHGDTAKAK